MKRIALRMVTTLPLLACMVLTAGGSTPAPRIAVDEPNYNFGEKHNNQTIEHTFVIRNAGDAPLEITSIRSSCGCTVGHVSSRNIPPGGTSEISGRYNLVGRQGTQRSVLTVETNDPQQPRTQLTMSGVAVQEMQVRPPRVFFGQIYAGEESSRSVEILGLPDAPFEITQIQTTSGHFIVTEPEQIAPHHYRFRIEITAPHQAGSIDDTARIHTTHHKMPVIEIPINAAITGALFYTPNQISLLSGNTVPVTRYIVVRPGSVRDFEITDVSTPSDDIRVQILNVPQQGYRIQLTNIIPSDQLAGQSVRIRTNVETMPEINIPFAIIEIP